MMNTSRRLNPTLGIAGAAATVLVALSFSAMAQQRPDDSRQSARGNAQTVYFPSGDRSNADLMLEVRAPDAVRIGEPARYHIRVTNISDSPLAGVTVVQNLSDGLELDAAAQRGTRGQAGEGSRQQESARSDSQRDDGSGQSQRQRQDQERQQDAQRQGETRPHTGEHGRQGSTQGSMTERDGQQHWNIGELHAGESRELQMVVIPNEEGSAGMCLTAVYQPAICTVFEVTQPQVKVIKDAPATAYVCEYFEWRYIVENTGTARAENVVLEDRLPEGLLTMEGENQIQRDIGTLDPGEQRQVTVRVSPQEPGQFASRARLTSAGAEARSQRVGTEVIDPVLTVAVRGPEWTYPNERVTYTISVTNDSDAPAEDAVLNVDLEGAKAGPRERELGRLEAGETIQANLTVEPDTRAEEVLVIAQARSLCAEDDDRARDRVATAIRRIPALLLETVDNRDPVRVGETTTYAIKIKNQGNATASNVQLTAELPPEMTVVDASGDVNGEVQGNSVVFGPVDVAEGDVVAIWLEAKADSAADITMRTELSADYLDQPVPDVEPTRLIPDSGEEMAQRQQDQRQARVNDQSENQQGNAQAFPQNQQADRQQARSDRQQQQ